MKPLECHGARTARQADAIAHLSDGADRGELLPVTRHEQHSLFLTDVHGERDRHAREDDEVVQRDQKKATHQVFTFVSCLQEISG